MPDPAGGLTEAEKAVHWFERARHYQAEVERLRTSIGHAEKEALRVEIKRLREALAKIEQHDAYGSGQIAREALDA